jgi:1-deoxy-D-xylulose-5-phosphate reductoisomerase
MGPAGSVGDHAPIGVALLGSTGSIGTQAVDVITAAGPQAFHVVALAAGRDVVTLRGQARALRPAAVAVADADARATLDPREDLGGAALLDSSDALVEMAVRDDVDLVVVATGGVVSLRPIIAALEAGKVVATANKETLVAGGHLVMPLAATRAAEAAARDPTSPLSTPLAWVRPIDSEHSAIWQCLVGEDRSTVRRLILTASGGPFRDWPAERLRTATPRDALAHPTWDMGAKITIDSATLMNKGLEVIEARWLYDMDDDVIDVVIHPQSLVHSLVEFVDGSVKAQLGLPDMRIPIQYAIDHPARRAGPAPRLDLLEHPTLTFEAPDHGRFPALAVARDAGRRGSRASAALIAADDVAVERFLDGAIGFGDIAALASEGAVRFGDGTAPDVEELEALDAEVRAWARTATPRSPGAA